MSSSLADFLTEQRISVEELLRVSRHLESWRGADRALAVRRRELRRGEPGRSYAEAGIAKPRSGRALGRKHVQLALSGIRLPRVARAKLVRALTVIAARRGQTAIDPRALVPSAGSD